MLHMYKQYCCKAEKAPKVLPFLATEQLNTLIEQSNNNKETVIIESSL